MTRFESVGELIGANEDAWAALRARLAAHDNALIDHVDSAGWSSKDHLTHLLAWQRGVFHVLRDGWPQWQGIGVSAECYARRHQEGYDGINEIIRQRHAALALSEVVEQLQQQHDALQALIRERGDAALMRPVAELRDDTTGRTVGAWIADNMVNHVEEHHRYIAILVGDVSFAGMADAGCAGSPAEEVSMHNQVGPTTRAELNAANDRAWDDVQALVARHTEDDLTTLHDSAGWTSKDHLAHLTVWLRSAVLPARDGITRWEALGVSESVFATRMEDDFFRINEAIRQQHAGESLETVMADLRSMVEQARDLVESSSDANLQKPIDPCNPAVGSVTVFQLLNSDGWEHFDLHRGYIAIILGDDEKKEDA